MSRILGQSKNFFKRWANKGQSVLEYAIIVAVVSAAFLAMSMYLRRAVQGTLYRIESKTAPAKKLPGSSGWGWGGSYPVPI